MAKRRCSILAITSRLLNLFGAADTAGAVMAKTREKEREKRNRKGAAVASGAALALGALTGGAADAATFEVSNLDDAGAGSLRQALLDANAAAGADTITFQTGLTGTITLTTGELAIADSLDIQGPGAAALAVSGNNASRVFYVYSGSGLLDVTISGLTVTGGSSESVGGGIFDVAENLTLDDVLITGNTAASQGGGLHVLAGFGATAPFSVTIRNSTVSGNTAESGGGAAFYLDNADGRGTVLIQDSVISDNGVAAAEAANGGGIFIPWLKGDVTIERSTVSGNDAEGIGGGIAGGFLYAGSSLTVRETTVSGNTAAHGGGLAVESLYGSFLLENSTVSGNQAAGDPGSAGGGVFLGYLSAEASAVVRHTTVAGNTAVRGGGLFVEAGFPSLDHSIVAGNSAEVGDDLAHGSDAGFNVGSTLVENPEAATLNDNGGNIFNQDPQLGPLQDNGGPTQTHLPAGTSPAVNAGEAATLATDQRGVARPVGTAVDLGAVEVDPGTIQLAATAFNVNENAGTVTVTATRTGGTDGAVSVSFATSDGTALSPADYAAAAGALNWASGDAAPKTFQVAIVDDGFVEGSEIFNVALANPQGGATLGAIATAAVTILDDEVQGPSAAEIPTLGDVGKLLLGGLVGLAGLLRMRRRKLPEDGQP
jgi:hypothetical protein